MQTVISFNIVLMILNAQDRNFSKSSSSPLLLTSSAWAPGLACNYELVILLLISYLFQLVLSPFLLSYIAHSFGDHLDASILR